MLITRFATVDAGLALQGSSFSDLPQPQLSANAGVHVYRRRLDACLQGLDWTVSNDADGWTSVARAFSSAGVGLVAIDVIGGFERGLVQTLQANGLMVARVGTRQALDFARSRAAPTKVDRVNARVLRDLADVLASRGSEFPFYLPQMDRS